MKGERLGELEELALLSVMALGRGAYGVAVQETIEREASRAVALGAVYAALDRLERKGFVRSALSEPTAERGGKRRRLFEVTPAGLTAARNARQAREALWRATSRAVRGRV